MNTNNNKNGSKNIVPEHQLGVQVGNANIETSEKKSMRAGNFIEEIINSGIHENELQCACGEYTLHICDQGKGAYVICYTCGFDSRETTIDAIEMRDCLYHTFKCGICTKRIKHNGKSGIVYHECVDFWCRQSIDNCFFSEHCSEEERETFQKMEEELYEGKDEDSDGEYYEKVDDRREEDCDSQLDAGRRFCVGDCPHKTCKGNTEECKLEGEFAGLEAFQADMDL